MTVQRRSRVLPLAEAIRAFVHPGDTIHAAYNDARPNAALMEVLRRFRGESPGLTLVTAGLVSPQHALVHNGVVTRLITSFAGENYPKPRPNRIFQAAVQNGRVTVENWSLLSLTTRLMAGALGLPYMPVRSLAGSGLAADLQSDYREVDDPFGSGSRTGVVSALRPDVVLLQGVVADASGNVVLGAPFGEGAWGALAARRGVIACVERIVSTDEIRAHSALVKIPAHVVLAVCEVPFGSHPYGLYNPGFPGVDGYIQDDAFMTDVLTASRTPAAFDAWTAEWIAGTRDHAEYLAKIGSTRLDDLAHAARPGGWRDGVPTSSRAGQKQYTGNEYLIVTAAREIRRRVESDAHDAILAGVGHANLASWLAVDALQDAGLAVELMAEIGIFGYRPQPGEPYIFSHRNLPTCTLTTDVMTVLGAFVGGPSTRSLGVIGAGYVDQDANSNSTWAENGGFLLGSGGANDIASAADELLVMLAHERSRLLQRLSYVTSPGSRVRTIVTSAGVFHKHARELVLTRYLPLAGEGRDAALDRIAASCPWPFAVTSEVAPEPPPSREELDRLRSYDPKHLFLGSELVG
ncbi:CoA-transferase [Actinophytocola sp.]|uniref:CoA-transferase n=1 Tax=Actinophytocola sp. TaxID=1872138 RepID=UPI003D6AB33D